MSLASSKNERQKVYLGDGVYVTFDGWSIVLTTENGVSITNTIFLEPEVIDALLAYMQGPK